VPSRPSREVFEAFVHGVELRLRVSLTAVFGQEAGRDAAASALAYAWEHWERVSGMVKPVGYLYRVGQSSQRRRKEPVWHAVPEESLPDVEPGLPAAIAGLSEKQRLAVVLVHAYGWERGEVATLAGVSVSAVDTHLARGLFKLRQSLRVESSA
jgi:DNA-directed RNA polymerase specialized sigma24 family protein